MPRSGKLLLLSTRADATVVPLTVMQEAIVAVQFESKTNNPMFDGVYDIAPAELEALSTQVMLVDVREPSEYNGELGHIAGTELIPLGSLPDQLEQLPKDKTIVFVCRSGNRSGQASAYALMNGWTNTYNMKGGMLLWNSLLLPVER